MKIIFIADFKNESQSNGGYYYATQSIENTFKHLKSIKKIKDVVCCDFRDLDILNGKKFDYLFLICNPNGIWKHTDFMNKIMKLSDNRFLHILWETSPLPISWKPLWGFDYFTGFFTPSRFLKNLIEKETDKPVYYTPYSASENVKPIDIEVKKNENYFNILVMGQITKRKGIEDSITAYIRTFSTIKNNTNLILKCFRLSRFEDDLENIIIKQCNMNSMNSDNLKIYTLDKDLNREEIFDLYRKSSLLLTTSRGEGFALFCQEAMQVGLPVIYTNWLNLPEVCNPENKSITDISENSVNLAIRCIVDEAIDMVQYGYEPGTNYAIPIMKDIMTTMYFKYNQWLTDKEKYYTNAKQNIDLVNKYFSLERVSGYYEEILKKDK